MLNTALGFASRDALASHRHFHLGRQPSLKAFFLIGTDMLNGARWRRREVCELEPLGVGSYHVHDAVPLAFGRSLQFFPFLHDVTRGFLLQIERLAVDRLRLAGNRPLAEP